MTLPQVLRVHQILRLVIRAVPSVVPYLSKDTIKAAAGNYDDIRQEMEATIYDTVLLYLEGTGSVTSYRNAMSLAVSRAYVEVADAGYSEGGAELPLDSDTAAWARSQLDAQLAFIDQLFDDLKEIRKGEDFDAGEIAQARAAGYASGLDGFYNEAVLRGSQNQTVEWVLGSAEKHCPTCLSLSGKSHRISWYIDRDYIPRKNGAAMECGGYNCDCSLVDKDGNEVTI